MAQQQNNSIERNANNTALRQPASYPSPQQYPSPSMSSYAYPPAGQNDSSYRASPTGSNVSLPSLNLPPIRTIDGRQQHQPQHQGGPSAMPPALAPPINHQFYPGHTLPPPQHMHVTSDPNQPMRYPLPPPPDGRIMSGGRHKKEIKRRTKTGCLTCRKRRIKCDEAHPACRNCQKSKRDCLGYDPIFKTQPGPTNIQPAPITVPNMQTNPAVGPSFHPPLQGYIPGGTHSYAPPLSAGANSSRSSTELYSHDNGAAIDPALETADGSSVQGPRVKRTKIEELCAIGDISPPTLSFRSPLQNRQLEEIQAIYLHTYAPALDKFFETSWFREWSLRRLLSNHRLCDQFATMLLRFSIEVNRQYHIPNVHGNSDLDIDQKMTRSLETTVVWAMMGLAQPLVDSPDLTLEEKNAGVFKAAERFETLENLLLGQYLDPKPPSDQTSERNGDGGQGSIEPENKRQYDFWRHVRTFLTLRDDEASAAKEIDDTLANCRTVLESYENRDIIYSIMIARHIGQRLAEFPDSLPRPTTNDEVDNKNKLHVAKSFIDRQQGKGTTQVVQRVCNMVVRSWSLPR